MRNLHITTLLLVTMVFVTCFASCARADEPELKIRLVAERAQYIQGETIYFGVIIENVSNHDVLIPTTWGTGDKLFVQFDNREAYDSPYESPSDFAYETAFLLQPGNTFNSYSCYRDVQLFDKPAKFKVRAVFRSKGTYIAWNPEKKERFVSPCWKGEVVSDWAEFEIIEPSSDEDKAAYAILTDNGTINIWTALSPYEYKKAPSETWWRVIKEHPTSSYARLACEAEAQRIVLRPKPVEKEGWGVMWRLREFAEKHWPQDILVDVIDAQIVACLYGDEKDKEAEELAAKIKERAPCARVLQMLDWTKYDRELVKAREKRLSEEAARNAQQPSPPTGPGPNPPPSNNAGGTSGPPNATDTGTSSQGGEEGAVAEARPFPWAIVIVAVAAALCVGAIAFTLLRRTRRR